MDIPSPYLTRFEKIKIKQIKRMCPTGDFYLIRYLPDGLRQKVLLTKPRKNEVVSWPSKTEEK